MGGYPPIFSKVYPPIINLKWEIFEIFFEMEGGTDGVIVPIVPTK